MNHTSQSTLAMQRLIARKGEAMPAPTGVNGNATLFSRGIGIAHSPQPRTSNARLSTPGTEPVADEASRPALGGESEDALNRHAPADQLAGLVRRRTTPNPSAQRETDHVESLIDWRQRQRAAREAERRTEPTSQETSQITSQITSQVTSQVTSQAALAAPDRLAEQPARRQLTVRLPEPVFAKLRNLARETETTYQELQEAAIEAYLNDRQPEKPRAAVITRRTPLFRQ